MALSVVSNASGIPYRDLVCFSMEREEPLQVLEGHSPGGLCWEGRRGIVSSYTEVSSYNLVLGHLSFSFQHSTSSVLPHLFVSTPYDSFHALDQVHPLPIQNPSLLVINQAGCCGI